MYKAVASLGAFGASCESCSDFYSGGKDYCIGYLQSCPDHEKCCPTSSLYNMHYQLLKGTETARWVNEKRVVFYVLRALLDPQEGSETGIDAFAWEAGKAGTTVFVDPAFVARVRRAGNNWASLFPSSRWTEIPAGVLNKQCGVFKTYTAKAVDKNATSYKRALNDVLTKGSYQDTASKFDAHALAVITSVPGGAACDYRDSHPDVARDLLATVPVPPAKGSGYTVAAKPWLDEFLRVFAPPDPKGGMVAVSSLVTLRPPQKKISASPLLSKVNIKGAFVSEEAQVGGGPSKGVLIALGIGAVAAVGVGVVLLRKKR